MKMYAFLTKQGTAARETALCEYDLDVVSLSEVIRNLPDDVPFSSMSVLTDCTDNDELTCVQCGASVQYAQA